MIGSFAVGIAASSMKMLIKSLSMKTEKIADERRNEPMSFKCGKCGYETEKKPGKCPKCGSKIWSEMSSKIYEIYGSKSEE